MKRDVRDKRKKYLKDSMRLKELTAPCGQENYDQIMKMRKAQKELYEKWRFYDGIIKANEKFNKEEQKQD